MAPVNDVRRRMVTQYVFWGFPGPHMMHSSPMLGSRTEDAVQSLKREASASPEPLRGALHENFLFGRRRCGRNVGRGRTGEP